MDVSREDDILNCRDFVPPAVKLPSYGTQIRFNCNPFFWGRRGFPAIEYLRYAFAGDAGVFGYIFDSDSVIIPSLPGMMAMPDNRVVFNIISRRVDCMVGKVECYFPGVANHCRFP